MKQKEKGYLPVCPYCGKPISFFEAWFLHTQGEYTCTKCQNNSDIHFSPQIYTVGIFSSMLSIFIVVLQTMLKTQKSIMSILFVLFPFLIFYAIIPFLVNLEKIGVKRTMGEMTQQYVRTQPQKPIFKNSCAQNTTVITSLKQVGGPPQPSQSSQQRNQSFDGKTAVIPAIRDRAVPAQKRSVTSVASVAQAKTNFDPGQTEQAEENIQDILEEFIDRYGE